MRSERNTGKIDNAVPCDPLVSLFGTGQFRTRYVSGLMVAGWIFRSHQFLFRARFFDAVVVPATYVKCFFVPFGCWVDCAHGIVSCFMFLSLFAPDVEF